VRTLDPDNLDRWISSWNRGLKEPENLQMSRDILVNVVEAALGELEQAHNAYRRLSVPRGAASWRSEVLGLLELHFKRSTLTIELLRAEHGDKIVDDLGVPLCERRDLTTLGRSTPS
jgi:hypothetical protein